MRSPHRSLTRLWLCILALLTAYASSGAAFAQAPPPPVRSAVDGYGVDLLNGTLRTSMPAISIGQPGAGGLAYGRTFDSSAQVWRDNLSGVINSSGGAFTVTLFGGSQVFTQSGANFVASEPDGSSLTFDAGTNRYTYTTRDGAVAVYDKALAGTAPTQANEGRVISFTAPNGEVQTFTYVALNSTTQRLQSLNNTFGYQLKFEYQNNDPATGGLTLVKVTAINNAVDYCSPSADTCTGFSQTWPSLSFDAALPTTVTDALGRVTRFTYTNNRIIGIRRPSSASTDHLTIAYDASNRVNTVSNGSATWTYAYADSANGIRTTTITDPLSHQRVITSNIPAGVVMTDRDALNRTTTFNYDDVNRLTVVIQPEGNFVGVVYDARGNVVEVTEAPKPSSGQIPITTTAAYPATCANTRTCNQATSTTDARGFRTDYAYNATHGGVETITAPAPSGAAPIGTGTRPQTRISYQQFSAYYRNSSGAIVAAPSSVWLPTETSACATTASCTNGADETRTMIGYGSNGIANNRLPVSITVRAGDNAVSSSTAATYDGAGNVATIDGPLAGNGDLTRLRHDAARQLIGAIGPDPDGAGALKHRAQRYSYNPDGQVILAETGTVNSQSDADWSAFAPLEQVSAAYDVIGRRVRSELIAGGATQAVVQSSYDAANRLECAARRMNAAVFGALPASACALSTQGSAGPDRIVRYAYTNADQVSTVTSGFATAAPIQEATTTYTNNGLPATVADGAGNVTTFVYDGFDRLSRQRYPNAAGGGTSSTDYEEYSYNAAHAVTQARRRDGQTIGFSYDNLLRVSALDAPGTGEDVAYVYDLFSRTLSAAKAGQTLSFAYDALSRLTSAAAPLGAVAYQYDAASRRTRMTWPDAFFVAYDYDVAGAVTAMRENGAASGAGVLASFAYDDLGRRTSLTRGNGAVTAYAYDAASRLATLTQNLPGTSHDQTYGFSYNTASQITQRASTNTAYNTPAPFNGTTAYADNGLNQYTSVAGVAPTYDARGNLTAFAGATYGYDIFNRMISATPSGGSAATLAYDPAGRLHEIANASATTRFLYDGAQMIAEYNASNVLQRRYVFGPGLDEPIVWYEGAGTGDRRHLVQDERGSVVAINGATNSVNAFDEYGTPGATNVGRFQYTGQMWLGEAGVYHYKARAYVPQLGRFAQTDPIGFAGGMNIYAYVANDPINFTDPLGLAPCREDPSIECADEIVTTGRRRERPVIPMLPLPFNLFDTWQQGGGDRASDGLKEVLEEGLPPECPSDDVTRDWRAKLGLLASAGNLAIDTGHYTIVARGGAVRGGCLSDSDMAGGYARTRACGRWCRPCGDWKPGQLVRSLGIGGPR